MTSDFIFDAGGQVVGYRCRIKSNNSHTGPYIFDAGKCNRIFLTPRGLRMHQKLGHRLYEQLSFKEIETLEKRGEL